MNDFHQFRMASRRVGIWGIFSRRLSLPFELSAIFAVEDLVFSQISWSGKAGGNEFEDDFASRSGRFLLLDTSTPA